MTTNLKTILSAAGIPVAAAALLLASALPALASTQGSVSAITLKDTNANGQIDVVELSVANPNGAVWAVQGTPASRFVVHGDTGLVIPVTSVNINGSSNANTVLLDLHLDETSPNLAIDTSASAVDVQYTPADGSNACANCFEDGVSTELAPIAFGSVRTDAAAPVITSVVPPANGFANDANVAFVINFSEPMIPSLGNLAISPNINFNTPVWSNNNQTVTLAHTSIPKQTYMFTLTPSTVSAASGSPSELNASGALDAGWTFGVEVPPTMLFEAPGVTCNLLAPMGGTTVTGGTFYQMSWSGGGQGLTNGLFSFSNDGGQTWKVIGSSTGGTLTWAVPATASTTAQIKLDCRDGGGGTLASIVSGDFTIYGTAAVSSTPAPISSTPAPVVSMTPPPISSTPAPVVTPTPVPVVVVHPAPIYVRDLKFGSTGADVTLLQKFLVQKKLMVWPKGVAYGYFGNLTRTALMKLQAGWRLPITGVVDVTTRAALNPR